MLLKILRIAHSGNRTDSAESDSYWKFCVELCDQKVRNHTQYLQKQNLTRPLDLFISTIA